MRRARRLPPLPGTDPDDLARWKRESEVHMRIFDIAPPDVREEARRNPEGIALKRWWALQDEWIFQAGQFHPKPKTED